MGYALSSEEHRPATLVGHARRAEEAGFDFLTVSDHFHPWIDEQGQSSFVWVVIGAVANATTRIELGTGVTCPLIRMHPAIVAQAAATVADMMEGRFFLGLGTGENLNEHVVGRGWPPASVRLDMLEESMEIIRELFSGENVDRRGRHFTVENARLYTIPQRPPRIMVAASGPKAAELAGRLSDGLISTAPDGEVVQAFEQAGGAGKPRFGQITVCWAPTEREAKRTASTVWPNAALKGELTQELALPRHFEQAVATLSENQVADSITCGPDPERYLDAIRTYSKAGFDHISLHQVGPDQEGFMSFYESELAPKLG
jgi:coenzyme F420-dependent glucose-6-phosphate dehydrogenase